MMKSTLLSVLFAGSVLLPLQAICQRSNTCPVVTQAMKDSMAASVCSQAQNKGICFYYTGNGIVVHREESLMDFFNYYFYTPYLAVDDNLSLPDTELMEDCWIPHLTYVVDCYYFIPSPVTLPGEYNWENTMNMVSEILQDKYRTRDICFNNNIR